MSLDPWGLYALGGASVRVVALLLAAPVFGHGSIPVRLRVALAVLIFAAVGPAELPPAFRGEASVLELAGALLGEILVGATLGFALRLVFAGMSLMGEFVSVQGGLGAARVLDPTTGASSVALAALFDLLMLAVFFAVGGHHAVVHAIADSYRVIPLGGGPPPPSAFEAVVGLGSEIFGLAVRLAAPVTVAMIASNVALGVLGRVAPQLNLLTLQLPGQVAATLALLCFGAATLVETAGDAVVGMTGRAVGAVLGG